MAIIINESPTPQEVASDLTIDREYIIRKDIKIQRTKNWIGYKDLYPGQRQEALSNAFKTEIEALEKSGIKYRINSSSSKKVEGKGKNAVHMDIITTGLAFSLPAEQAKGFLYVLCRIYNDREITKLIPDESSQIICQTLKGTDAVRKVAERIFMHFAPSIQKDKDQENIIISGSYKFSCVKSGVNLDKKTFIPYAEIGCEKLEENQILAQNAAVLESLISRMRREPYIEDVLVKVVLNGRPKHEFHVLYAGRKETENRPLSPCLLLLLLPQSI